MPDKLTDNEIIKALECRVKDKCPECPYFHGYPCDKCRNMQTDAFSLITRQKAEIERLKKANETFTDIGKMYSEIKAEAYKEFAERLNAKFAVAIIKNISVEFALGYKTAFIDITDNIDNLLKKMVGDDK